jgi:hypothetical protein
MLAADTYHGGFNQAFEYGECTADCDWIIWDVDFSSAYMTAKATLPAIDWSKPASPLLSMEHVDCYASAEGISGGCVPIILAQARFKFPPDCPFPCLPVDSPYGLLYPLEGVTLATGVELALARRMGADVTIDFGFSLPTLRNAEGERVLAFAGFLGKLAQAREAEELHNPDSLRERMLKEFGNSFYGKMSQGVDERTIYNFSGRGTPLPPSAITTPHYAAMTTGIVRAALCALVAEVSKHPGCRVLSATTDGAMLLMPRYCDVEVGPDGKVKPPKDARDAMGPLYDRFLTYYPIRCLEQGRINLGVSNLAWLKVKHGGDRAVTARTRGYHLTYKGRTQYYARAATQVKDTAEWERLFLAEGIESHTGRHLATMKEIMEGRYKDLVNTPLVRKVNLDWDFKRIPLLDGTGRTRPPRTVEEVYAARDIADGMRKHGQRATPERVQLVAAGRQTRGGTRASIYRALHQAVAHNLGGWRPHRLKDVEIAKRLDIPATVFKNYKRRKQPPQSLPASPDVEAAIADVAQKLGLTVTPAMRSALLATEAYDARPAYLAQAAVQHVGWEQEIDPADLAEALAAAYDASLDAQDEWDPENLTEEERAELLRAWDMEDPDADLYEVLTEEERADILRDAEENYDSDAYLEYLTDEDRSKVLRIEAELA